MKPVIIVQANDIMLTNHIMALYLGDQSKMENIVMPNFSAEANDSIVGDETFL